MEQYAVALKILKKLNQNGFRAYIVGGYVRDKLLSVISNDIDIATNALPQDIEKMFETIKSTADKYLSCRVLIDDFEFEVTTFRKDIAYHDHRHPITEAVNNLEDDLKRRDFTINALALDSQEKIIDLYGGLDDIRNRLVKAIGDPYKRFDEDTLRIFRGCYLVSKLNFEIDDLTLKGMQASSKYVVSLSDERIIGELIKILNSHYYKKGLLYLQKTNASNYLKLDKSINYIVKSNIIPTIDDLLAISFYLNEEFNFKLSKEKHELYYNASVVAKEGFTNQNLYKYDIDTLLLANRINGFVNNSALAQNDLIKYKSELPIASKKDLQINANELINIINKPKGAWIKEMLDEIEKAILENKIENEKNEIIKYIKEAKHV